MGNGESTETRLAVMNQRITALETDFQKFQKETRETTNLLFKKIDSLSTKVSMGVGAIAALELVIKLIK